jgi:hypothetical protein
MLTVLSMLAVLTAALRVALALLAMLPLLALAAALVALLVAAALLGLLLLASAAAAALLTLLTLLTAVALLATLLRVPRLIAAIAPALLGLGHGPAVMRMLGAVLRGGHLARGRLWRRHLRRRGGHCRRFFRTHITLRVVCGGPARGRRKRARRTEARVARGAELVPRLAG